MTLTLNDMNTGKFYLEELKKIENMSSSDFRYNKLINLSNKWMEDVEIKQHLTDGFCQYLNEYFIILLENCKPVLFKDKVKNFFLNMKKSRGTR